MFKLQVFFAAMASKSKRAEADENMFLPPPVDLDRIPLVDKDYLISETRCEFDFVELQSWFKDTFIDQSDEIGLWESNLPLYFFPQVHHFPEFALKFQAHYLPDQRTMVSLSGEKSFLYHARQAIDKIKREMGDMPIEENKIIRFINSKTREDLEDLKIEDRTKTILEVKRIITKRGLMLQLEEKFQNMNVEFHKFFSKIDALQKKGFPSWLVLNNKIMTLSNYKEKISMVANDSSKFLGIHGSITSKVFLETLQPDLSIQHEVKYIFIVKPKFAKYTEVDEIYRRMLKITTPSHQRWEDLCNLIE
jgi:hypothetical protein